VIAGFHAIVYSDVAEATRALFRDVLGWPSMDAGGGWLIVKTAPSELGVSPTSEHHDDRSSTLPFHQASLMCDDLEATVADLRTKGVAVDDKIVDQGSGLGPRYGCQGPDDVTKPGMRSAISSRCEPEAAHHPGRIG
jgi:hypothetical protein